MLRISRVRPDSRVKSATQAECADALCTCRAAGYTTGDFVSASNNMCTTSFTSSSYTYWDINGDVYRHGSASAEAQITARCEMGDSSAGLVDMAGSTRTVEVRIREGGTRGVLQVNIDGGGWDAVCDDGFGGPEANAACRQLGFSSGTSYDTTHGDDSFALDDLDCPTGATSLSECSTHREPYEDNCGDGETVGIDCSDDSVGRRMQSNYDSRRDSNHENSSDRGFQQNQTPLSQDVAT